MDLFSFNEENLKVNPRIFCVLCTVPFICNRNTSIKNTFRIPSFSAFIDTQVLKTLLFDFWSSNRWDCKWLRLIDLQEKGHSYPEKLQNDSGARRTWKRAWLTLAAARTSGTWWGRRNTQSILRSLKHFCKFDPRYPKQTVKDLHYYSRFHFNMTQG